MKLKLLCLTFITSLTLANAQEKKTVTLPAPVAEFYLVSYLKGQRDSILLRSAHQQNEDLVSALTIRGQQIESYRRDSASSKLYIKDLTLQKKNSVDSTKTVGDAKLEKVKRRSTSKSWIIGGLGILLILLGTK